MTRVGSVTLEAVVRENRTHLGPEGNLLSSQSRREAKHAGYPPSRCEEHCPTSIASCAPARTAPSLTDRRVRPLRADEIRGRSAKTAPRPEHRPRSVRKRAEEPASASAPEARKRSSRGRPLRFEGTQHGETGWSTIVSPRGAACRTDQRRESRAGSRRTTRETLPIRTSRLRESKGLKPDTRAVRSTVRFARPAGETHEVRHAT